MKLKPSPPVFMESLAGVITVLVIALFVMYLGVKDKEAFYSREGTIVFLDSTYQELPVRDMGKYRYLKIDSYPGVFELFTGTDPGDFSPEFEKLSDLKAGDRIVVWYDESDDSPGSEVNRMVQHIDKDGKPYFILGTRNLWLGAVLLLLALALGGFIYYLKKSGKIT